MMFNKGERNAAKRPEVKEKMRLASIGRTSPMKGKRFSENHKEKLIKTS